MSRLPFIKDRVESSGVALKIKQVAKDLKDASEASFSSFDLATKSRGVKIHAANVVLWAEPHGDSVEFYTRPEGAPAADAEPNRVSYGTVVGLMLQLSAEQLVERERSQVRAAANAALALAEVTRFIDEWQLPVSPSDLLGRGLELEDGRRLFVYATDGEVRFVDRIQTVSGGMSTYVGDTIYLYDSDGTRFERVYDEERFAAKVKMFAPQVKAEREARRASKVTSR